MTMGGNPRFGIHPRFGIRFYFQVPIWNRVIAESSYGNCRVLPCSVSVFLEPRLFEATPGLTSETSSVLRNLVGRPCLWVSKKIPDTLRAQTVQIHDRLRTNVHLQHRAWLGIETVHDETIKQIRFWSRATVSTGCAVSLSLPRCLFLCKICQDASSNSK